MIRNEYHNNFRHADTTIMSLLGQAPDSSLSCVPFGWKPAELLYSTKGNWFMTKNTINILILNYNSVVILIM